MTNFQIPHERLLRQRIAGEGLKGPADVVRWMGAVQSQDYAAAKWAVGLRTEACTEADVEAAFAAGEILRTHVMRPTWHFVAPEDIRWMQDLTADRVRATLASQFRALELDGAVLRRCNEVMVKALRGGRQLTRAELAAALERAGVAARGIRLAGIVINAELEAVVCSGARRGKQFTYALVDERAPQQRRLEREEALALLTERYFTSHGPATLRDYAWWSGLAGRDVQRGLEMVKSRLLSIEVNGQSYWMTESAPPPRFPRGAAHFLPNYDEYIVGYTDRAAVFDDSHIPHLDARHNPVFQHTIVRGGQIVGTWKRTAEEESLGLQIKLFSPSTKADIRNLGLATKRMAKFFGLKIVHFEMG